MSNKPLGGVFMSAPVQKIRHLTTVMQHRAKKRLYAKRQKRMPIGQLDKTRTPMTAVARRFTAARFRQIRSTAAGRGKLRAAIQKMKP